MAKLSDVAKTYIEAKYKNMTPKAIAKKLDVDETTVVKYIQKISVPEEPVVEQASGGENLESLPSPGDLMRRPAAGAIVMTEEASVASEESSKNRTPQSFHDRYTHAIQKCKHD